MNGDVLIINVDGILCETIKHVNKEYIGAFHGAAYGKMVTVLKEAELTGLDRFSGARKSVLLKASSGECCAPQNFVHLATFRGTHAHLIVYLVVHQRKYLMER